MKRYNELSEEEQSELHNKFLREPDAFYERAETAQLKEALRSSYKDRFLKMTSLMKISIMLSKAKITHSDSPSANKD